MRLKKILRVWCLMFGCTPKFKWDKETRTGGLVCGVCGADSK